MNRKLIVFWMIPAMLSIVLACQIPTSTIPILEDATQAANPLPITFTPTPASLLPIQAGTPLPFILDPLTAANVAGVENIIRITGETVTVWDVYHTYSVDPSLVTETNYYLLDTNLGVHLFGVDISTGYARPGQKIAELPRTASYCGNGFEPRLFVGSGNQFAILTEGNVLVYDPTSSEFVQGAQPSYILPLRAGARTMDGYTGCQDDGVQVRFSADMGVMAVAYPEDFLDGDVYVFEVRSGSLLNTLTNAHSSLDFSPDGKYLMTVHDLHGLTTMQIWDVATGTEIYTSSFDNFIADYGFSPDGVYFYVYPYGETYMLIHLPGGGLVELSASYRGSQVRFSRDGSTIALQELAWQESGRSEWKIFDLVTGEHAASAETLRDDQWENPVRGFIDRSFAELYLMGDVDIQGYECDFAWQSVSSLGYTEDVYAAFLADGSIALVRSGTFTTRKSGSYVIQQEWQSETCRYDLTGLMDCQSTQQMTRLSPDGGIYSAIRLSDKSYEIRDSQGATVTSFTVMGNEVLIGFMVPPTQEYLVVFLDASDAAARFQVIDIQGNVLLDGGELDSQTVAMSLDGRYFGVRDSFNLSIFNMHGMNVIFTEKSSYYGPIVFLPDGAQFAYIDSQSYSNLAQEIQIARMDTHHIQQSIHAEEGITAMAFNADGSLLALGYSDGTISVVDVVSGDEIVAWQGHYGIVEQLLFSPDSQILLSIGGLDRVVNLWGSVH